jgi:predicted anti-sigma-YlaC factor YlaD
MNCRDAERLLSADRDGALEVHQRAALETHLAGCSACRRWQATQADAGKNWRESVYATPAPDSTIEWHAIRRRIRNGETPSERASILTRSRNLIWASSALAAALLIAVILAPHWLGSTRPAGETTQMARAEFVEGPDGASSPLVYVDNDSGWLVIWTVDDGNAAGS